MPETRTNLTVSTQDNLRKKFEEKNAVISIGMDRGKYHDASSFAVDLLRSRGEQFTPVADAMSGEGEINYGTFLKSRMGVRVTQDFPENFAPDTNILGVAETRYSQTRRERRAKAYEKWVKWRDNMENASKQAYAILRLGSRELITRGNKDQGRLWGSQQWEGRHLFLMYSRDIPVNYLLAYLYRKEQNPRGGSR